MKGVDLVVENIRLDRLLTRIASRLRKFGRNLRNSQKNIERDERPVALDALKKAWVDSLDLNDRDSVIKQLNAVRSVNDVQKLELTIKQFCAYVTNIVGLLGALRTSDIGLTCMKESKSPKSLRLIFVNWKTSDPKIKSKKILRKEDIPYFRTREIVVKPIGTPGCPYIWIQAWRLRSNLDDGLLFRRKNNLALSIQSIRNSIHTLKLLRM